MLCTVCIYNNILIMYFKICIYIYFCVDHIISFCNKSSFSVSTSHYSIFLAACTTFLQRYAANGIDGLLNPVVKPSFGVHFGNPYGGTVHGGHYRGLYRPTAYNGNPFQFDVGPLTINPFGGVRFSVENGRLGIRPSLDVLVSPNFKERPYYPPPYTHAPYVQHPYPPYPQYPYQNFRRKRGHSVFRPSVPLYTQPYLLHSKANEATTLAKESHTDGRDDIFAKAS